MMLFGWTARFQHLRDSEIGMERSCTTRMRSFCQVALGDREALNCGSHSKTDLKDKAYKFLSRFKSWFFGILGPCFKEASSFAKVKCSRPHTCEDPQNHGCVLISIEDPPKKQHGKK